MFAILVINFVNPQLYSKLPKAFCIALTMYYSVFPIKDMISRANKTKYKGKQFAKNYVPVQNLDMAEFEAERKRCDRGALRSIIFWLCFMAIPGILYSTNVIGREWIIFLSAMSDFCVYFAIFFWCPFHKIILKPHCCMDCRIFNWDSFFSFSFLIFIPSIYTYILFSLGLISLIVWEINYKKQPERFYKMSNESLSCECCDMEHCKGKCEKNELKK